MKNLAKIELTRLQSIESQNCEPVIQVLQVEESKEAAREDDYGLQGLADFFTDLDQAEKQTYSQLSQDEKFDEIEEIE